VPREDVEHLKARLKNLPDYMQGPVKELVKQGPRLEALTSEQMDVAHEFVSLLEDEVGAPFVTDVETAGKT
jgi:hypothetical protein